MKKQFDYSFWLANFIPLKTKINFKMCQKVANLDLSRKGFWIEVVLKAPLYFLVFLKFYVVKKRLRPTHPTMRANFLPFWVLRMCSILRKVKMTLITESGKLRHFLPWEIFAAPEGGGGDLHFGLHTNKKSLKYSGKGHFEAPGTCVCVCGGGIFLSHILNSLLDYRSHPKWILKTLHGNPFELSIENLQNSTPNFSYW